MNDDLPPRCVEHLVSLIVRTVENNTSRQKHGLADGVVSLEEAKHFVTRRRAGQALIFKSDLAGDGEAFAAAMQKVRERLHAGLRNVKLLDALDDDQIATLRDAMSEAPFKEGEFVFEQGDAGDAFYFIMDGEVEVLRHEGEDEPEKVLAVWGEGRCFGERALIKSETRFASVRATKNLSTMCISRDDFERTLGHMGTFVVRSALKGSKILGGLHPQQREVLREAMHEETFTAGETIFCQGDDGSQFYVILTGEVEILRYETDLGIPDLSAAPKQLLKYDVPGSSFGERSLIKNDTRFASAVAVTPVQAMVITRSDFEEKLGQLSDLIPDEYA